MWAYLIGGIIGVGLAILIQIVPQWEGFINTRSSRNPEAINYLNTVLMHIGSIGIHSQYELGLLFVGIVVGIWKREQFRLQLVLIIILAHLSLGVMASAGWDHYPMPLTPLYALIIASALDDITLWLNQANRDQNSLLLFGSLFLLPMFGVVLWMGVIHIRDARTLTPPEPPVVTWIEANIPPDALIEGEHYYYHWLFEYDYVSPLTHTMMNREQYEAMGGFEGVWSQIPIDFYLLDYNLNTCCIMNRLVESGFMAERNYEIVYEQNGIVIYGNPEELMVID